MRKRRIVYLLLFSSVSKIGSELAHGADRTARLPGRFRVGSVDGQLVDE